MIIEKLISKQSNLYKKFNPTSMRIGEFFDNKGLIHLFSIWTLIVSGIVVNMNSLSHRHHSSAMIAAQI